MATSSALTVSAIGTAGVESAGREVSVPQSQWPEHTEAGVASQHAAALQHAVLTVALTQQVAARTGASALTDTTLHPHAFAATGAVPSAVETASSTHRMGRTVGMAAWYASERRRVKGE